MKRVVSVLIIFILIISSLSLFLVFIMDSTILKEKYIFDKISDNNYYIKVEENIKNAFQEQILQSGLEEGVFDGLITDEKIRNDIDTMIKSIYSGEKYTVETESIATNLKNKINDIMAENNKKTTKEETQAIDKFIKSITSAYINEIVYISGMNNMISNILVKVVPFVDIAKIILIVVNIVLLVILFALNKNFKFLSISLFSVGFLIIIFYVGMNYKINVDNILLFNQVFSNLIANVIKDILFKILICGICSIVVSIFIIIINLKFTNLKIKGKREK